MNLFEVSAVMMLPAGCWRLRCQHRRFDGGFQHPPDVPKLVMTAGAGYLADCFFFPFLSGMLERVGWLFPLFSEVIILARPG